MFENIVGKPALIYSLDKPDDVTGELEWLETKISVPELSPNFKARLTLNKPIFPTLDLVKCHELGLFY